MNNRSKSIPVFIPIPIIYSLMMIIAPAATSISAVIVNSTSGTGTISCSSDATGGGISDGNIMKVSNDRINTTKHTDVYIYCYHAGFIKGCMSLGKSIKYCNDFYLGLNFGQ